MQQFLFIRVNSCFLIAVQQRKYLQEIESLRGALASKAPLVRLRALPTDVHDIGALSKIASVLCPE